MSDSDDFNRADSATVLGSTSGARAWTQELGTWGISSNQAYTSVASTAGITGPIATIDLGVADVGLSVDVSGVTVTNTEGGLVFRYVDANNFWFFIGYKHASLGNRYYLSKVVAGAQTDLTAGNSGGTSYTLSVDAAGSSITARINGSSVGTFTDSALSTATKHGINTYNSTAVRLDNFVATTAAGAQSVVDAVGLTDGRVQSLIAAQLVTDAAGLADSSSGVGPAAPASFSRVGSVPILS